MARIHVLIATMVMLSFTLLKAQKTIEITGKVVNYKGDAISNIAIVSLPSQKSAITDLNGTYKITIPTTDTDLEVSVMGYNDQKIKINGRSVINFTLTKNSGDLDEVIVIGYGVTKKSDLTAAISTVCAEELSSHRQGKVKKAKFSNAPVSYNNYFMQNAQYDMGYNTENYSTIHENGYKKTNLNPLSTFSIDVDKASYSNVRRFINSGSLPPKDAVRIEELVNYFSYNYPEPNDKHPFSTYTELSYCPWESDNYLLMIGIKGKEVKKEKLPPSNLVFLIDVSGSMQTYNKLPLVKQSLELLVNQLTENDKISIVVYAGSSGLVLSPTTGDNKTTILNAINRLEAGGSTAGGAGLKLAYKTAEENYLSKGNNRIILCTDGDFNVGASSDSEMERLIEQERQKGIYISVLGYGMGNYKDSKMEIIADKGNGNYAYIDNINEAKKVLVEEMSGTLFTIAKDVKIQIEFNPAVVSEYRLIGYENRILNEEDFKDDKKDAGEIGARHTVTALYEIKTVNRRFGKDGDALRYQPKPIVTENTDELAFLKLRYKEPNEFSSKLITKPITNSPIDFSDASENLNFVASVAEFGMWLRESEFKGNTNYESIMSLAKKGLGEDKNKYRGEYIKLVKEANRLKSGLSENINY